MSSTSRRMFAAFSIPCWRVAQPSHENDTIPHFS
jgi:hypothetical protein